MFPHSSYTTPILIFIHYLHPKIRVFTLMDQLFRKMQYKYGNIKKANNHTLELRTVVQNLTNQPHTLRLSLKIRSQRRI